MIIHDTVYLCHCLKWNMDVTAKAQSYFGTLEFVIAEVHILDFLLNVFFQYCQLFLRTSLTQSLKYAVQVEKYVLCYYVLSDTWTVCLSVGVCMVYIIFAFYFTQDKPVKNVSFHSWRWSTGSADFSKELNMDFVNCLKAKIIMQAKPAFGCL